MKKFKINISLFNRYLILSIVSLFSCIFYLSIPALYNYESLQKQLERKLLDEFKFNISFSEDISYKILPSPSFEISNGSLYLKSEDKFSEFGQIKKLKIYISARSLYKQEKIKIKRIVFQESIFDINEKSWKFISNYFQNQKLKKKILIKKSKIFLKKNLEYGALAIFTVDNLDSFFNDKKNLNKLNARGRAFNTPFVLKLENDFNNSGNTKFILKFNEMNLTIKNNLKKNIFNNENQYVGNQTLNFIGSEIKTNYKFNNKVLNFSNDSSHINNKLLSTDGKIIFSPFYFDVNINLQKMNLFQVFDTKFLINNIINNKVYLHNNFNGNIKLNINELIKTKIFNSAKLNIRFKSGELIFNESEIFSNKFGSLKLIESQMIEVDKNTKIKTKAVLNIKNSEKFYQRFQISKNLRKPISRINFEFEKDLNSENLKIYKFQIFNKNKSYSTEEIDLYLKNNDYDIKINNIHGVNKFLKEVFKLIN